MSFEYQDQSGRQSSQLTNAHTANALEKSFTKGAPSTGTGNDQASKGNGLPSVNLPRGGGAIRGIGEKLSASSATGTATASIPLPVTPGRSGFAPALNLSYDSGAGNGPYGFGWSLSLPSVTRRTDLGLPKYHDEGESDIYQIMGSEDLVPVLERHEGKDWCRQKPKKRIVDGVEYNVYHYRPRIESAFTRIERWVAICSQSTHWRSITRTNVTTIFGEDKSSRVYDPEDPSRVFQWLTSQSYDDKGNAVQFEYKAENCESVDVMAPQEFYRPSKNRTVMKYLKRVKYGNRVSRLVQKINPATEWMFELVFDYGDHEKKWATPRETRPWPMRSDPFSRSRAGFEIRTYRLCRRVLMFHHFPDEVNMGSDTLVSSLDICYFENGRVKNLASASCASSFTKVFYQRQGDGYLQATLPPVEMEYSEATVSKKTGYMHPSALEGIPIGVEAPGYQFVDLDGEGATGILAYQGGAYYYKSNLGNGNFGPPVALPKVPTLHVGKAKPPQLMDLLGDGKIDMVQFEGATPGFYKRNVEDESDGWQPWKAFKHVPNVPWTDSNLTFVDLTGDGQADVLIMDDSIHTMYPSLLEDGFGPPSYWRPPMDENNGPRLLLSDGVESLFLADMTGDGLSDLVRIRYHEVCYWPNFGYGRFGQKVSMSNPPLLQSQDLFSQSRIRLADIDGTGVTDILYLDGSETKFYLNQSGNGWTNGFEVESFPGTNDTTNVQVVDLLAKGTACLVWSSDLASDFGTQVRYVDLMATGKPYLLVKSRNNLGSETRYTYASSTKFYLADKARGEPWVTRLPFPVQVVERTDTFDYISKNHFVTQYVYHHGYYDGIEKEFRGFGMVEVLDTEDISTLTSDSASNDWAGERSNWSVATTSPPVLTKTWFHTGAQLPIASIEDLFRVEYYQGDESREIRSSILPSSVRVGDDDFSPHLLNPKEIRESFRVLKGSVLHSETYSFDGTKCASLPYIVQHGNFIVEMLQPQSVNQHAIFQTRQLEAVQFAHDRKLYLIDGQMVPDPRVTHALTLKTDIYGNVLQAVTLSYGRRYPDSSGLLEAKDHQAQSKTYSLLSENSMTNAVDSEDNWLLPLTAESRTYELYNFQNVDDPSRILTFSWIKSVLKRVASGKFDLPYDCFDGPPKADLRPHRRLLQHAQTFFRKNDLTGPLKLGELQSMGFPYVSLQLAMTPQQVNESYAVDGKIMMDKVSDVLENRGGYIKGDDGNWWSRSPKNYYSPDHEDTAAQELDYGHRHFFKSCRTEDIFSTPEKPINFIVTYDGYDLLVQETVDPLGNRSTAGERNIDPTKPLVRNGLDYRLMTPWLVMDPNRNMAAVSADLIGLVVGTAILGKPEAPEGDSFDCFEPNLSKHTINEYSKAPLDHLHSLLGTATSRIIYDYWAYYKTKNNASPKPMWSSTLSRDTHVSQLADGEKTSITVAIAYFDGFLRAVQSKVQAETESSSPKSNTPNKEDHSNRSKQNESCNERWVGSGWVVYNNKGNPVRQFEPFFTGTHQFENNAKVGVSPIVLYDPLQRVVATVMPDHSWTKVVMDPWRTESWDPNDLVLVSDPKFDPDVGGYFEYLAREDYLPTWYDQRIDGQLGRKPQNAAKKTAVHAETPKVVFLDALKHPFVGFEVIKTKRSDSDQPTIETVRSSAIVDVQGLQHGFYDAMGRLVTTAKYNHLSDLMSQSGMENGQSWAIHDVLGRGILFWDSGKRRLRSEYDELRRRVGLHLSIDGEEEILIERTLYGESLDDPEAINARTRVIEINDQSGLITTPYFDFKGNLLQSGHQFAKEYRENINWEDEVALEETTYKQYISYDAKNRAKQTILPDGTITQYEYNARGLEKCITSRLHDEDPDTAAVPQADCNEKKTVTVNNIEYDARGQRKLIDHGNGVHTSYSYHPLTFLMTNLRTRRGSGPLLQDLSYIHDPVGNVTHIRDDAQQTIFFRNRRVEPSSDYTYDAVYRLVEAAGREHLGQTDGRSGPTPIAPSASDSFNVRLDLPSDGNAMGTYIETYFYDKVGNMQTVKHRSCDPRHPGWTRKYVYNERSQLEPSKFSNRLSVTSIGSITESYRYDGLSGLLGNMTAMAHLSSMKWDYRNQLRSTSRQTVKSGGAPETTWYVYNAAGQRVRKVTERQGTAEQTSPILSKERVYLGDFELYRKYGGDGSRLTLERETVHITDTRQSRIALAETRTQGSEPGGVPSRLIRYQLGNHLDSAVLELDDQAQIISYEEYFPFGSTSFQGVRSQLETPKRYRFTGKERDEENGLYYYGARYYAPWLARWTSCDPEGLADGSNLYVYARDSPTVLVDPDGRESTSQWKEMDYGTGESSKYYHLEGTDIYRRDTPRFSEAWHEGGGDQAVEFADDKITATVVTPEKILADSQKLDRSSFYLKYRTIFTPEQMKQVLQYVPYAPILKLPPGSNWIYMGEGGRVGTEDELAEAELAEKLENIHPPSEIGALYGIAATVLGADAKNVAHMIQVGDQLNNIVSPILSMTIMASAAKNKTEGGSLDVTKPGFSTDTTTSPTPDVVQPPTNARSPLVDWHYDPAMTPQEAVQDLADMVHAKLTGNRALISDYLSDSEIQFAARGPWAERMVFGKALERAMGEAAAPSGLLVQTGDALMNQKGSPDLMGLPGTPFQGLEFQVTTVNQYRRGVHESKDGTLFILHNGL